MGLLASIKNYAVTGLSVIGRVVYNSGQALYSMNSVVNYFMGNSNPASSAGMAGGIGGITGTTVAVAGTLGSTLLGKTVPTYDRVAHPERHTHQTLSELNTAGKFVDYSLRGSGLVYGTITSISAYFLTMVLSNAIDGLISAEPESALWKSILMNVAGGVVAVASFYNYFSNDYRFIKENTHQIADSLSHGHIACNANMAKTLATTALNLATFPAQAYFFAKPAIQGIPYVGDKLGPVGENVLTGVACATTFLTVASWLPSVYNHFAASTRDENQREVNIPVNCKTRSYKIASYTTGLIDSIGNNGLGPFISVIFTMNQLFDTNPYGWVIGLAALCGLNAMFMNLLFSVKQGTNSTLETIYRDDVANVSEEEQALLGAERGESRFYTEETARSGFLVFATIPTETPAPQSGVEQEQELRNSNQKNIQ